MKKVHLVDTTRRSGMSFVTKCGRSATLLAKPARDHGRVFSAKPARGAETDVTYGTGVVTCKGCLS